jgi:hypothetical protein
MSNNDLTHKGDGSSQRDTDHNSSMNPNRETSRGHAGGHVQEKREAAPSGQPEPSSPEPVCGRVKLVMRQTRRSGNVRRGRGK